jgi:16S rRNA (adenine1518-N6/adenine1519-N6)-dimethyltransferase
VRTAFDLSAGVFWPQPRVTSSVVVMELRDDPLPFAGQKVFTRFTRGCFASRRKTLRNNLKAMGYSDEALEAGSLACGISTELRAEALSPEKFAALYAALSA